MASEAARERAERWARTISGPPMRGDVIDDLAALLDQHARAELEAAADCGDETGDWDGAVSYENIARWLRARAARIGGGE